jgi:hypothetical protein
MRKKNLLLTMILRNRLEFKKETSLEMSFFVEIYDIMNVYL